MSKSGNVKDLPLYRRVLLFSFFITFLVVISTGGMVFFYQSNQMENQLAERAKGIASLWNDSIPPETVQAAIKKHDDDAPELMELNQLITDLMEKNSKYFKGYVVIAKKIEGNQLSFITISNEKGKGGAGRFSNYSSGKEYLVAFNRSMEEKELTWTQIYSDLHGMWITAFEPITNEDGEMIAVFAVNIDASGIEAYRWKMGLYLLFSLLLITTIVYLTLKWGLKKVFEPIQEIIAGINAVSAGNFDVKLQISDESDFARLSDQFNQMTEHLTVLFDRLSATSKEFGAIPDKIGNIHRFEEAIDEMEKIIAKTKLQKELQRAEKMNAIGQLAASVAHEIRNPMTVVRGFLQIFLAKDNMNQEELTYIQLMIDELNRAEMIINDYLSLAKPDLDLITKVDASQLAVTVMDLMNTFALMSKNISLEKDIERDVFVKGNLGELKQVLINIVKNGIEAMRSGGTLTFKVYTNEQYGVFEITDTGIGMSSEEMDRLGTAFYSLKEKGTGMGLMVCYQIVERIKGKIEVHSVKGEGTTFRICLPIWEDGA